MFRRYRANTGWTFNHDFPRIGVCFSNQRNGAGFVGKSVVVRGLAIAAGGNTGADPFRPGARFARAAPTKDEPGREVFTRRQLVIIGHRRPDLLHRQARFLFHRLADRLRHAGRQILQCVRSFGACRRLVGKGWRVLRL